MEPPPIIPPSFPCIITVKKEIQIGSPLETFYLPQLEFHVFIKIVKWLNQIKLMVLKKEDPKSPLFLLLLKKNKHIFYWKIPKYKKKIVLLTSFHSYFAYFQNLLFKE